MLSPKYWNRSTFDCLLLPRPSCGFGQEQSWGQVGKAVTDLPLPKYVVVRRSRGGRETHKSGLGEGSISFSTTLRPVMVRIESHAGVDCPAPEVGKRGGFGHSEWGRLRVSHRSSRPGSFRALKISKLYISPIEISREKKPSEVDDELMIGRGSHSR